MLVSQNRWVSVIALLALVGFVGNCAADSRSGQLPLASSTLSGCLDAGKVAESSSRRFNAVSDEFLWELHGQVSQDSLMGHVEALTNIETRYTFRPEFLQAARYVYETLESYGVEVSYDDHVFGMWWEESVERCSLKG